MHLSGEQFGTARRELHIGPGLVQPQPAQLDCECERGAELVWRAAFLEEGAVDPLDVNAAVLDRLDRVGDLDQLAGGVVRSARWWLGSMNFADMA